jgi:hypothetical protein
VLGPKGRVAVLTRSDLGREAGERRPSKGTAVDAFDVFFEAPLDELDRALCLAAAIFVDRLSASGGDNTSDRLLAALWRSVGEAR